ncbi:hypothetical protein JCGZ_25697 [Jatropha curcas]|uniref:Uncharacterized protein n=1 Tax=Jatropha curcas TaxID=180498 RepID=A0A067LHF3_JATCU|nr:hypothetical protein JCGZ_25697 [Jatropha curcas]
MSQISEIPASAYTPEMETLGALPDILTFDGEPVGEPESINPRDTAVAAPSVAGYGVPGPSLEHLRDAASEMRGATSWLRDALYFEQLRVVAEEWHDASAEMRYAAVLLVNLGKARSGGLATDVSAFWDLLDPPMRARVVAAGFGDYAPHAASFPARYAICIDGAVERLYAHLRVRVRRDDSHTRGLRRHYRPSLHWPGSPTRRSIPDSHSRGPAGPFFARCHLTVWSYEYCIYPGGLSGDSPVESREITEKMVLVPLIRLKRVHGLGKANSRNILAQMSRSWIK